MTEFHFTNGTPPESLFSDIRKLGQFSDEHYKHLVDIVFTYLTDSSKSQWLLNQVEHFCEEQGVSAQSLQTVVKTIINIVNASLKKSITAAHLRADLVNLGLQDSYADLFTEKWKNAQQSLLQSAITQTVTVNQLVDMEWKFGVTAASSELKKVGNTFLQLKLVINKGGNKLENVYMELSLPQFYSFLHELEKAKASLEYLS